MHGIYQQWTDARKDGDKKFVVLIDPDKLRLRGLERVISLAMESEVDYFFIGGSLVVNDMLDGVLKSIREQCKIPMVLFPGNSFQLSYRADALLFLSLISGRNAELLIGKHVITAPFLKVSPLEIISTGYMLVDGGIQTTVQYMSNTTPIPHNKEDIALCTAMAGEMLGLKMLYLDAGSGAERPVSGAMIEAVSSATNIPLIVGGGIKTPEKVEENLKWGADIIVVGNAIEHHPELIKEMSCVFREFKPRFRTDAV
ncbi:MAG: geranylgeranylglyceryl/heptaprenylglyceryl phosphate synthase [Saprospiraceae bacterium]|nr:geranylgeranylglyceryl/heptaprenylglyceryl phosphate synthase [Saprospiraceae bacterium]